MPAICAPRRESEMQRCQRELSRTRTRSQRTEHRGPTIYGRGRHEGRSENTLRKKSNRYSSLLKAQSSNAWPQRTSVDCTCCTIKGQGLNIIRRARVVRCRTVVSRVTCAVRAARGPGWAGGARAGAVELLTNGRAGCGEKESRFSHSQSRGIGWDAPAARRRDSFLPPLQSRSPREAGHPRAAPESCCAARARCREPPITAHPHAPSERFWFHTT